MPFIEQSATDLPGLVITTPDKLAPNDQIPYAKQNRVPDAFQALEIAVAQYLMIDRQLLVGMQGDLCEHGSILLLGLSEDLASPVITSYVVAVFDARRAAWAKTSSRPMLVIRQRATEEEALAVFNALREGLNG